MNDVTVKAPRTGRALYSIDEASDDEIRLIFDRAWKAYAKVRALSVRQRLDEAAKLRRYILDNKEQMVAQISRETGKCWMDALLAELYSSLDLLDFYEKNAERILRERVVPTPMALRGKTSRIWHEPLGPVLVIAPWNYPFVLSFQPVISAFLAGNSVLLKSSSYTPLQGLYETMMQKSGFVDDAIQIVYGTRVTGNRLIDMKPRKIFFTGSVGAGRKIMAQAAEHLIPVELELGGKDPMLVFADADIDRATSGALWGGMVNSGQTCTSVERIYVEEPAYESFIAALKGKMEQLRTAGKAAPGTDELELDMGCMTADFQVKTLREHVHDALAKGARLISGGHCPEGTRMFEPTILADVTQAMRVVNEESFGALVAVAPFKTEADAITLANASDFGLSASVWTADEARGLRVARAIETGNVSINNVLATQANSALPFGGCKDSGFGRYKGWLGLYSFSNIKSVLIDKDSAPHEFHWYPYSKKKYVLFSTLLDALYRGARPSFAKLIVLMLKLLQLRKREHL